MKRLLLLRQRLGLEVGVASEADSRTVFVPNRVQVFDSISSCSFCRTCPRSLSAFAAFGTPQAAQDALPLLKKLFYCARIASACDPQLRCVLPRFFELEDIPDMHTGDIGPLSMIRDTGVRGVVIRASDWRRARKAVGALAQLLCQACVPTTAWDEFMGFFPRCRSQLTDALCDPPLAACPAVDSIPEIAVPKKTVLDAVMVSLGEQGTVFLVFDVLAVAGVPMFSRPYDQRLQAVSSFLPPEEGGPGVPQERASRVFIKHTECMWYCFGPSCAPRDEAMWWSGMPGLVVQVAFDLHGKPDAAGMKLRLDKRFPDADATVEALSKLSGTIDPETGLTIFDSTSRNGTGPCCHGLILDIPSQTVVARPFPPMESTFASDEIVEATPKIDGTLGIMILWRGDIHVLTMKRANSEQGAWATAWARGHIAREALEARWTYLVEIVWDDNTACIDYPFEGLVLLSATSPDGADMSSSRQALADKLGIPYVPAIIGRFVSRMPSDNLSYHLKYILI
eukprot:m51a1_g7121 hypothetical protein (510) ;mRNA; r:130276-135800